MAKEKIIWYDDSENALVDTTVGAIKVLSGAASAVVTATPTITAGAYSAADALGGKLTFASAVRVSGGSGVIYGVVITDAAKQDAEIEIVLFDRDFTATNDNAAFDPSDADLANIIGVIPVYASDYFDFNDNSVACVRSVGMPFVVDSGTSLYGQMVIRDGDTYAATDDITVKLLILQD